MQIEFTFEKFQFLPLESLLHRCSSSLAFFPGKDTIVESKFLNFAMENRHPLRNKNKIPQDLSSNALRITLHISDQSKMVPHTKTRKLELLLVYPS